MNTKAVQYKLPPINGGIDLILSMVDSVENIAIGRILPYDLDSKTKWDSVVCYNDHSFNFCRNIKLRFCADNNYSSENKFLHHSKWLTIDNLQEFVDLYQLELQPLEKGEAYCVNISKDSLYWFKNQFVNMPVALGDWSNDFGGFGSYVRNPFDFEEVSIQTLGFLAKDLEGEKTKAVDKYFIKKYLNEYVERYNLIGKTIKNSEYNYPGRSGCNSWNHSRGEIKTTKIEAIADLTAFAYLGCKKIG